MGEHVSTDLQKRLFVSVRLGQESAAVRISDVGVCPSVSWNRRAGAPGGRLSETNRVPKQKWHPRALGICGQ